MEDILVNVQVDVNSGKALSMGFEYGVKYANGEYDSREELLENVRDVLVDECVEVQTKMK